MFVVRHRQRAAILPPAPTLLSTSRLPIPPHKFRKNTVQIWYFVNLDNVVSETIRHLILSQL